jgi:type II secretion system protein H
MGQIENIKLRFPFASFEHSSSPSLNLYRISDFGFRILSPARQTSPRFPLHANCSRGFTLLELMVVIVLIGIITALILPEMRGTYQDALLRSTGRELVNAFNIANSRAVSLNQAHRLNIDQRTGRYVLEMRVREDEHGGEFVPVQDVPGAQGELDTRITVSFRQPGEAAPEEESEAEPSSAGLDAARNTREGTILFYPDGTSDAREILLQDEQGFRLALKINPVTSRVHLVELGRE